MAKMDEKPYENCTKCDSQLFGTLHADLIGPMTPEAQWTHTKYSLMVHDDFSGFSFVFNLAQKDQTMKAIISLDKSIENKFQKRIHTFED